MKTSNYILTAFFTILFLGILGLFVAAKIQHDPVQLISNEKAIASFSVVVAEPGAEFTIKTGNPKIVSYSTQDSCYVPRFESCNDTLFIFPYSQTEIKQTVEIYGKNIHQIQGKENTQIHIEGMLNPSLFIHLYKASLSYFHEQNDRKGSLIKLAANESYVNMGTARFEKMEVLLNHTKIDGWQNSIDSLSGTLRNKSEVYVRVLKNINMDSDSTCLYNIRK